MGAPQPVVSRLLTREEPCREQLDTGGGPEPPALPGMATSSSDSDGDGDSKNKDCDDGNPWFNPIVFTNQTWNNDSCASSYFYICEADCLAAGLRSGARCFGLRSACPSLENRWPLASASRSRESSL